MLRKGLIWLSKANWANRLVSRSGLGWRMASRFIAGETRAAALAVVAQLNQAGINASLDHLGEHVSQIEEAEQSVAEVIGLIGDIQRSGLRANISIKLSQLGLMLDENICRQNYRRILEIASLASVFVRVDMEDSSLTEKTIGMVTWARDQGFTNTGIVIQAYLRRSQRDIVLLGQQEIAVRLCKGAYQEPAHVAFPKKSDVDKNYDALTEQLIEQSKSFGWIMGSQDGRTPPQVALATHDEHRIEQAIAISKRVQAPQGAVEFQMLFGIRRDLQQSLASQGYPVRVYIPFGSQWYPYFMRRLAERPANVWFFARNFFHK